jgi:hypothetical protein
LSDDFDHCVSKIAPRTRREPNENYPARMSHVCVNQLTEVLIFRNQDSLVFNSPFSNTIVFFPWRNFGNRDDVMRRGTKRTHNREISAFIGQKAHRLSSRAPFRWRYNDGFLVRQRVRGITYRRLDILYFETRIGIEQVIFRCSFTELSKNQLNRDARPPNDRLSHHHLWIDFYAISNRHRASQKCFQSLRTASSMACKSCLYSFRSGYNVNAAFAKRLEFIEQKPFRRFENSQNVQVPLLNASFLNLKLLKF